MEVAPTAAFPLGSWLRAEKMQGVIGKLLLQKPGVIRWWESPAKMKRTVPSAARDYQTHDQLSSKA